MAVRTVAWVASELAVSEATVLRMLARGRADERGDRRNRMSIHDGPYVPLTDRAKRLRDGLRHPAPCPGGDGCMCGLGLDLLIIEHEARVSVSEINALGAAWAEAEAALRALAEKLRERAG